MNIMNVNSALSAVQTADSSNSVSSAVSMEMLDQTLDMSQVMNDSLIKMMENSVTPHLGSNFDMSI